MEDIRNTLNLFTKSIERKDNIVIIYNYLSLLIAQMNTLYYKNNFFNSTSNCDETDKNLLLSELNAVSEKIRNLYPSFIQLRKEQFKNIFINKLECYKKSNDLLKNIEKSNKIQSMLTDLTNLLQVDSNTTSVPVASPPPPVTAPVTAPATAPAIAPAPAPAIATATMPVITQSPQTQKNQRTNESSSKTLFIIFFVIFGMILLAALLYGLLKVKTSKIIHLKSDTSSAPAEPAT
jgi:hypothetical protein